MKGDEENFYILTQNNKKINRQNIFNPYYGEITLVKVN